MFTRKMLVLFSPVLVMIGATTAAAEWTPLITAAMFDGIKVDMITAVGGILGLALIVFGLAMLMRVTR